MSLNAAWDQPNEPAFRRDEFGELLKARPALAARYAVARDHARRHFDAADSDAWSRAGQTLYHVNAGPKVLTALWSFEQRALPGATLPTLLNVAAALRDICRNAGSRDAARAIAAMQDRLRLGTDPVEPAAFLAILARLAERAAHAVAPVTVVSGRLMAAMSPDGIRDWIEDGLRLYPQDRRRQAAYFNLDDPLARRRFAIHEGASRFAHHEERLRLLVHALWGFDLDIQVVEAEQAGARDMRRTRFAGGLLLVPETSAGLAADAMAAFFEAAVLHAAAHRRFTRERFAAGKLKPMQIALTAIIEDARVERLAAWEYPGLARSWAAFHTVTASPVQAVNALFARLSRALIDPSFDDPDGWVRKGRILFEAAFAETPHRQAMSREVANVLGHDLGQLRIPFDGKSYAVEPAYRDDGLGLFDFEDSSDQQETLELMLEGARMEEVETDVSPDQAPAQNDNERARSTAATPDDEGAILGSYPEWDHRLNAEHPDHVTARAYPATALADGGWLAAKLADNVGVARRIGAFLRRARVDRSVRLKRQLEGEEIDIEAAQAVVVSRRIGETPDPRIHMVKRRQGRDLSLMLMLDTSLSTGDLTGREGATVLETSALSVVLLGGSLAGLGDPFAVEAFASDGRDDLRITSIKGFDEDGEAMTARLAGLQPGYSTRLGAAIRHGARSLAGRHSHRKVLILLTDGEPSDIDVDDPFYLAEDAKRAVARARGEGLDVFCVALGPHAKVASGEVFGKRNTLVVERIADLPQRLAALYFRLTVH